LDYQEALFEIFKQIFKRWRSGKWEELQRDVCNILRELDDRKNAIKFAAQIADGVIIADNDVTNWMFGFVLSGGRIKPITLLKNRECQKKK
jgi:hypothetical protein